MMDAIISLLAQMGDFFYPWLHQISTALIASTLIAFSGNIMRFVFGIVRANSFFFRTLLFILICGFGFGFLIVFLTPILAKLLATLPAIWLLIVIIASFIAVGCCAQKTHSV